MRSISANRETESSTGTRAVIYARMSTQQQRYSIENQCELLLQYASTHEMKIVRRYIDEGKSGLKLEGRDALSRLIQIVQEGQADFDAILVYDVSRWGRFQDADEGAYYEYLCRRACVRVVYCAEEFENDGSPVSTIVKGVKRAMAGEYSRELSAKVFQGQQRLIRLGFRQGGPAGFGLRRMLLDEQGKSKGELKKGQHKSIQTDRVVLVPGPKEEVEIVRWIYSQFTRNSSSEVEIAKLLNARGILTDFGRKWTRRTVWQILTNEKYIGNNVYNRISFKLKKNRVTNSPDAWIRADGAFEAIVDQEVFAAVKHLLSLRSRHLRNEELLDKLKTILKQHGYLSASIIDENAIAPDSRAYRRRFGSLIRAYKLAGYIPARDYTYLKINRSIRNLYRNAIESVAQGILDSGGIATRDDTSDLITINGEFSASIVVTRCLRTRSNSMRWIVRMDSSAGSDITIVVRMDQCNSRILDYYLFPSLEFENVKLLLHQDNHFSLDAYRFESLDYLFSMAERTKIGAVT